MTAASVQISETNGASPGSVTDGITNLNMGSTDAPNLNPTTYPITAGANSFEKWVRLRVVAMNDAVKIDNLRVYAPGATFPIGTGTYVKTSCTPSGYAAPTYATPVTTTSAIAVVTMPTSEPAENLGIGGSLSGTFTAAGYSDYAVFQVQTNVADVAGSTVTIRFRYDEVA